MCDEVDIVGADNNSSIFANYQVYRKIAASGVLSTGRVAQQLAIRKLLRRIDRPTAGNFKAWQEIFDRWDPYTQAVKALTEEVDPKKQKPKDYVVPKPLQDKANMEIQQEWHNLAGFLIALSGVTLNKEVTVKGKHAIIFSD
jgi:hypothetical protein